MLSSNNPFLFDGKELTPTEEEYLFLKMVYSEYERKGLFKSETEVSDFIINSSQSIEQLIRYAILVGGAWPGDNENLFKKLESQINKLFGEEALRNLITNLLTTCPTFSEFLARKEALDC